MSCWYLGRVQGQRKFDRFGVFRLDIDPAILSKVIGVEAWKAKYIALKCDHSSWHGITTTPLALRNILNILGYAMGYGFHSFSSLILTTGMIVNHEEEFLHVNICINRQFQMLIIVVEWVIFTTKVNDIEDQICWVGTDSFIGPHD